MQRMGQRDGGVQEGDDQRIAPWSDQHAGEFFFFLSPDQDELAYPVHHTVLETTSRNPGSELSHRSNIKKNVS